MASGSKEPNLQSEEYDPSMTVSGNAISFLASASVSNMQVLMPIVAGSLARVRFREILPCWVKIRTTWPSPFCKDYIQRT